MKKSKYYNLLLYIYKNSDTETRDYIKFILEYQAIKRGLCNNKCIP